MRALVSIELWQNVRITIKFGSFSMLVFLVIDVPKKKNIRNESQSFNDLERVGRFLCEPQVDGTVQCVTDVHLELNPQFHSEFITYKTETVSATENDHMENEQDARRVCALN